jgi:putative transposase
VIVQKAFKYRFFPTDEQAEQLARTFGCARYVYNRALEFRTTAWQQEKKSIDYHATAARLTKWKKEPEKSFLSEVSSVVLQQSLRNLDTAFTNFFEKRAQYPKFKSSATANRRAMPPMPSRVETAKSRWPSNPRLWTLSGAVHFPTTPKSSI